MRFSISGLYGLGEAWHVTTPPRGHLSPIGPQWQLLLDPFPFEQLHKILTTMKHTEYLNFIVRRLIEDKVLQKAIPHSHHPHSLELWMPNQAGPSNLSMGCQKSKGRINVSKKLQACVEAGFLS